jgi:hypothetical protein
MNIVTNLYNNCEYIYYIPAAASDLCHSSRYQVYSTDYPLVFLQINWLYLSFSALISSLTFLSTIFA